jgi:hypothetical protein
MPSLAKNQLDTADPFSRIAEMRAGKRITEIVNKSLVGNILDQAPVRKH